MPCTLQFVLYCWTSNVVVVYNYSCTFYKPKEKATSVLENAINSFHQVNSPYDGTINCFSMVLMSAAASNEVFTYKQALKEDDYQEFIKAMLKEIKAHEEGEHWTMIS